MAKSARPFSPSPRRYLSAAMKRASDRHFNRRRKGRITVYRAQEVAAENYNRSDRFSPKTRWDH